MLLCQRSQSTYLARFGSFVEPASTSSRNWPNTERNFLSARNVDLEVENSYKSLIDHILFEIPFDPDFQESIDESLANNNFQAQVDFLEGKMQEHANKIKNGL